MGLPLRYTYPRARFPNKWHVLISAVKALDITLLFRTISQREFNILLCIPRTQLNNMNVFYTPI